MMAVLIIRLYPYDESLKCLSVRHSQHSRAQRLGVRVKKLYICENLFKASMEEKKYQSPEVKAQEL